MEDPKSWTSVEKIIDGVLRQTLADETAEVPSPGFGLSHPRRIADALRKAELVLPEAPGMNDLYREVEELPGDRELREEVRRLVNRAFMRGWRDCAVEEAG